MDSTGQSVPKGTWTPWAIIVCQLYAPMTRYSPRRASAQRLSEMACDGCIEAMTPKELKRAKSEGATTCACSMRWRGHTILVDATLSGPTCRVAGFLSDIVQIS